MLIPTLILAAALSAPDSAPRQPASVPTLQVDVDGWRRTVVLELGPITLPGSTGGYAVPMAPILGSGTWGVNGWLRGFRVEMLDARGRPLGVSVLHHVALVAPDQRDLFGPMARHIVAFGQETDPIPLPRRLGYPVHATDSLRLVAVLFNPGDTKLEGVRLRMTVDYALGRIDGERSPVLPFLMNAAGGGGYEFDVPPGGVRQSWEWSPAVPGGILALGGHLHAGAVAILLEDATEGTLLWRGEPVYEASGALRGVTRKGFLRPIRIRPDHRYRVTAIYDNPTDRVVHGAMGHVGGLFLPDRGTVIPDADRTDPAYVADEMFSQRGEAVHMPEGMHMHHP